jgi:hypothetical protein
MRYSVTEVYATELTGRSNFYRFHTLPTCGLGAPTYSIQASAPQSHTHNIIRPLPILLLHIYNVGLAPAVAET